MEKPEKKVIFIFFSINMLWSYLCRFHWNASEW